MKPSQVPVVRMLTAVAAPPMSVATSASSNAAGAGGDDRVEVVPERQELRLLRRVNRPEVG